MQGVDESGRIIFVTLHLGLKGERGTEVVAG